MSFFSQGDYDHEDFAHLPIAGDINYILLLTDSAGDYQFRARQANLVYWQSIQIFQLQVAFFILNFNIPVNLEMWGFNCKLC